MLLAHLEARMGSSMGSSLDVVLLDVLPPEDDEAASADCDTSVHILLLQLAE
tara:strand:- start:471 stop:626 length:156 start_codon:yes stop_codon:yes gene_type:complete